MNVLANTQRGLNKKYSSELSETVVPKDATEEQKEEINEFNRLAQEERKTELPPVYQPLLVNCDLLFGLADKLGVSSSERTEIDTILHPDNKYLFLTVPLDNLYRMGAKRGGNDTEDVNMEEGRLSIPAKYVNEDSIITVTKGAKSKKVPGEWRLETVNRETEGSPTTFVAKYVNDEAAGNYSDGDKVTVTIENGYGETKAKTTCKFRVCIEERWGFIPDSITFERIG